MTVGEALAEARTRADLSIDDVSERSRIRQVVIHGIEQDDYEVCGGELYVRGYLRVIADALGIDAQPLIDSYDSSGQLPAVIVSARRVQEPPAPPRPARLRSVPSRLSPSRLMPPRSAPPRSGPQPVARHAAPSSARPAAPAAPPARPAAPFQTRGPASSPAVPPPEMFQPLPGVFQPPAEAFQPAPGVFQSAPEMFQPARPAERPESVAEMMRNPPEGGFPRAPAGLRETSADQPALSYGSGFRSGPGSRSRSGSGPGSGSGSGRNGAGRADRRRSASEPGPR
ncbi:MAG: helix-turn-helix domain-containing protein, partial [Nocardiopsaceae bacterium]|nr:helix-turn-helix domain-containing protein [Nocardiopsaceae bacterium]